MIHSIRRSNAKMLMLNAKELRHRAGVAWVQGKRDVAEMFEVLAMQKGDLCMPGNRGPLNESRGSSYFKCEHSLAGSSRKMGAI